MERKSEHQPIFERTDADLLVQVGVTASFSSQDSASYLTIKAHSLELRALIERNGLSATKSPTLSKLIEDAVALSDAWLCNRLDQVSFQHLLSALQIERIATATLPLGVSEGAKAMFADLLNGPFDLLERQQSKAKDTFWELELLHTLVAHGIKAATGEPDLVYTLSGPSVGVACKKIYSEANVPKVLSNAVKQIEKGFDFGIVAINIDDLLPPASLLKASTVEEAAAVLAKRNDDFLRSHERHLRRYLEPGRAMSAVVSCAAIADIQSSEPRFLNLKQATMWQIPGLPQEKEKEMQSFFAVFGSAYPASG